MNFIIKVASLLIIISLVYVSSYSRVTYKGRDEQSSWRIDAAQRIDKIRKTDITILVRDENNRPVRNATVHLKMTRHSFPFGSAVSSKFLTAKNADAKKYQALVLKNYNKVVLENDLKLRVWEKSKTNPPGSFYELTQTFKALKWLNEHDISIRGHYLAWGWLEHYKNTKNFSNDPYQILDSLKNHIKDKKEQIGNLVVEWDALNHPLSRRNRATLETSLGQSIYTNLLKYIKSLKPDTLLYINEGNLLSNRANSDVNLDDYEELIRRLISQNAPIDGIGFMGHIPNDSLRSPEGLLAILDRFSGFGLPIQITEFDVIFGDSQKNYEFSDWELKLQADYTRDFMTIMFSHPAVNGIIMWGFWEGRHWYPGAALYRKDWSTKPNGEEWENLVFTKWWTDIKLKTDALGAVNHRVFLGEYNIIVTYDNKTISIPYIINKDGDKVEIIIRK